MQTQATVRLVTSEQNWIEGEAIRQLEATATLPGMKLAVGMPDLHPGRGYPIGAAFVSQGVLYPHLVGNDIGCGMGLWSTSLRRRKIRLDRWVARLDGLDDPWEGELDTWLAGSHAIDRAHDMGLGTIGGGNHFAELQQVEAIHQEAAFAGLGLDPDRLFLLVHSGSRGLGQAILRSHVERFGAQGLNEKSVEAQVYLADHDQAVRWAAANRSLIAHRFLSCLRSEGEPVLDVTHNTVTSIVTDASPMWLHRKGVTPSDAGAVVIPGSRGAFSYLVEPLGHDAGTAYSLAHGAGRKWNRRDARQRLRHHAKRGEMTHTALGSRVICDNKDLMYEEAPQAYKNVDIVVQNLVEASLIRIIAVLRPVITYKTRRR